MDKTELAEVWDSGVRNGVPYFDELDDSLRDFLVTITEDFNEAEYDKGYQAGYAVGTEDTNHSEYDKGWEEGYEAGCEEGYWKDR